MFWLLVFGLLHFYLIWFGDILVAYALTGLLLFFFRNLSVRALIIWGVVLIIIQCALMAMGAVVHGVESDQAAARSEFAERFAAFAGAPRRRLVRETFA